MLKFNLPSPALVVSMLALALALGGTAVAATTGGDTKADTALVKKLASSLSVQHAKTADIAASGQPVAFAHVSSSGVLDFGDSKNVATATNEGMSTSCLGLAAGVTVRGGQATVDFTQAGNEFAQFGLGDDNGSCPAGTKAFVWTAVTTSGVSARAGFFVLLYG